MLAFLLLFQVLLKPCALLKKFFYKLNYLQLLSQTVPLSLEWIIPLQILYPENISFSLELFWVLILTQTYLAKIKKRKKAPNQFLF